MEELLPDIKKWYDGYHFGSAEIYNPWSVLNFFKQKWLGDYWVNTSGNTILGSLLQHQTAKQEEDLLALLRGTHVFAVVREGVTYEEIHHSRDALYIMLVATGYLTVLNTKRIPSGIFCELALPNREVKDIFQQEVLERFHAGMEPSELYVLVQYLVHGEIESFSEGLAKYITQLVSVYDTANKESFYHGLVLGMTALVLPEYTVESNRESGYGRFDVALFPKRKEANGVILEFKVAQQEDELESKAHEALQQIQEKEYDATFEQRGVRHVWKYGIAFCDKKAYIMMK